MWFAFITTFAIEMIVRKGYIGIIIYLLCNFYIGFGQSCQKPFGISFPEVGLDSIRIQWLQAGSSEVIGYQVAYGFVDAGIGSTVLSDTLLSRAAIIRDLLPNTQYEVYVRSFCRSGGDSDWNGPFDIATHLSNPTTCGTSIFLDDDNCTTGGDIFFIEIDEEGFLGFDVFLESVDLILEHDWLSDLEISIENPSGRSAILTQFIGPGNDNFGIVTPNCDTSTHFSSNACTSIIDGTAPFIGTFAPITSLSELNDGTSSKGLWKVKICDRSFGDKGELKHIKVNLATQKCEPIDDFFISDIRDNQVRINWTPIFNCESLSIEYGESGFVQGSSEGITLQVNCKLGQLVITDLDPSTSYDFYLISDCFTSRSAPSCKTSVTTQCKISNIIEFDDMELCEDNCITTCTIENNPWQNSNQDDSDWIVWNGNTETDLTGPQSDVNQRGNYIYLESNTEVCGDHVNAVLTSACINVGSNPGCGFSFYAHMIGQDQGQLEVLISNDNRQSYSNVLALQKTEGWEYFSISLDNYIDQFINIRIIGTTGNGPQSDIALDELTLHGSSTYIASLIYFDEDMDGYGRLDSTIVFCGVPDLNYSYIAGDCNDIDQSINPDADEIRCNGIDENCNGLTDDNPTPPTISVTTLTPESCFGLKDGRISLDILGDDDYTIVWNTGQAGSELENLSSGFYRATITDQNSCAIATPFYEIVAESKIDISLDLLQNATCDGRRDGSIVIRPEGGVRPYTYEWNIDQIQATIIGLVEGDYSVTVTDKEGCIKEAGPFHIGIEDPLMIEDTLLKHVSCKHEMDGAIGIEVTNGQAPYNIEWEDGYNLPYRDQLESGIYTITITDRIGCREQHKVEINEPDSLVQRLLSVEQISCNGINDGLITTKTFGGTPPFEYNWSNGSPNDDLIHLGPGAYTLTVTDNNGCTFHLPEVVLNDPPALQIQIDSISGTRCTQSRDGYIGLSVEGGLSPLTYFWRRTEGDSLIQDQLLPGNYGFTAVDRNGCKLSLPNIIVPSSNTPSPIEIAVDKPIDCPGYENGKVIAIIDHIATPAIYNWSNGRVRSSSSTSDTINNLRPGSYKVTITDAEGCVSESTFITLDGKPTFQHEISHNVPNQCNNDSSGVIGVSVTGGTPPFVYNWSNGNTSPINTKLSNGVYNVSVTDALGCPYVIPGLRVNSTSDIDVFIYVEDVQPMENNGVIELIINGGIAPYEIQWSSDTLAGLRIENLAPGAYPFMIRDSLGCSLDSTGYIKLNTSVLDKSKEQIRVFPNPASTSITIRSDEPIQNFSLLNLNGKKMKGLLHQIIGQNTIQLHVGMLPSGLYLLQVDGDSKVSSHKILIIH